MEKISSKLRNTGTTVLVMSTISMIVGAFVLFVGLMQFVVSNFSPDDIGVEVYSFFEVLEKSTYIQRFLLGSLIIVMFIPTLFVGIKINKYSSLNIQELKDAKKKLIICAGILSLVTLVLICYLIDQLIVKIASNSLSISVVYLVVPAVFICRAAIALTSVILDIHDTHYDFKEEKSKYSTQVYNIPVLNNYKTKCENNNKFKGAFTVMKVYSVIYSILGFVCYALPTMMGIYAVIMIIAAAFDANFGQTEQIMIAVGAGAIFLPLLISNIKTSRKYKELNNSQEFEYMEAFRLSIFSLIRYSIIGIGTIVWMNIIVTCSASEANHIIVAFLRALTVFPITFIIIPVVYSILTIKNLSCSKIDPNAAATKDNEFVVVEETEENTQTENQTE